MTESKSKFELMSIEQFKENIKVGDTIEGYVTNQRYVVTAIGRTRFLFMDPRGIERTAAIVHQNARWRKV